MSDHSTQRSPWSSTPRRDRPKPSGAATARAELLAPGSPWRLVAVPTAMALGSVGAIAASRAHVPLVIGAAAGAAAALLGVFALPSLPTKRVVVVLLGLGGLGALRHASFTGGETTPLLVVWALSTLVALLLVDRAVTERVPRLRPGRELAPRGAEITRMAVAIAVIAAVIVVAFGPTVADRLGRHVWPGLDPSIGDALDAPSSLRAADSLDMTQRPRLSDKVVFRVSARRASFWRGQTFDSWDGRTWRQSDARSAQLPLGGTVDVPRDSYDVGAFEGRPMRQTFRMETDYSNVVFAAPSLVTVQTDKVVEGHPDGTATVYGGFGRGATYTVTSRSLPVTAALLRAASGRVIPADVVRRFAQPAPTTDRVNALARTITASAPTTYDKILAIEAWLGDHVRYSLNAPLSPPGVDDVVDDFLFRSRVGWCEQVASSLVVLARSVGIPARLATGFVPGRRDPLSGEFVVRERDAHAWAEVYFGGVGWQPFDPTASVPLAGDAPEGGSWLEAARHHAFEWGVLAAALVLLVVGAPGLRTRWRRRQARRRAGWAARSLDRLERIGRKAGRTRRTSETPREYASALATYLHDERIRSVGETLDVEGFSADGAPASARADADAVLSSLRP